MDGLQLILVLVIAVALWILYHKVFHVVYFNAIQGLFREAVICIIIAGIIVFGISGKIGDTLHPKEELPYLGIFHNLEYLNGSGFDTMLTISEGEKSGELLIKGYSTPVNINYVQSFEISISRPEGDSFTCDTGSYGTLSITFDSKENTLTVTQEVPDISIPAPYTGTYVADDVWWNDYSEERKAATEVAEVASEPNGWIEEYFGSYVWTPFLDGEEYAPYMTIRLSAGLTSVDFRLTAYDQDSNFMDYYIPYPRGPQEDAYIEYMSDSGLIAFEIELAENGMPSIEIKNFPQSQLIGSYSIRPESFDVRLGKPGILLKWDGTYVCNNGGEDGSKTLAVTQNGNTSLSIDMIHNYANGNIETYHAEAEIGAFGKGPYFAACTQDDKTLYFNLEVDPTSGEKVIQLDQLGIYPAIDLEYDGTYQVADNYTASGVAPQESHVPSVNDEQNLLPSESVTNPSDTDANVQESEKKSWYGTYVCNNGGADGSKTLIITPNDDSTLQIQMSHTYEDGRVEEFECIAEIGTYSRGDDFASYEGQKTLYFTLELDRIEVTQIGIYPDKDLEFDGTYSKK